MRLKKYHKQILGTAIIAGISPVVMVSAATTNQNNSEFQRDEFVTSLYTTYTKNTPTWIAEAPVYGGGEGSHPQEGEQAKDTAERQVITTLTNSIESDKQEWTIKFNSKPLKDRGGSGYDYWTSDPYFAIFISNDLVVDKDTIWLDIFKPDGVTKIKTISIPIGDKRRAEQENENVLTTIDDNERLIGLTTYGNPSTDEQKQRNYNLIASYDTGLDLLTGKYFKTHREWHSNIGSVLKVQYKTDSWMRDKKFEFRFSTKPRNDLKDLTLKEKAYQTPSKSFVGGAFKSWDMPTGSRSHIFQRLAVNEFTRNPLLSVTAEITNNYNNQNKVTEPGLNYELFKRKNTTECNSSLEPNCLEAMLIIPTLRDNEFIDKTHNNTVKSRFTFDLPFDEDLTKADQVNNKYVWKVTYANPDGSVATRWEQPSPTTFTYDHNARKFIINSNFSTKAQSKELSEQTHEAYRKVDINAQKFIDQVQALNYLPHKKTDSKSKSLVNQMGDLVSYFNDQKTTFITLVDNFLEKAKSYEQVPAIKKLFDEAKSKRDNVNSLDLKSIDFNQFRDSMADAYKSYRKLYDAIYVYPYFERVNALYTLLSASFDGDPKDKWTIEEAKKWASENSVTTQSQFGMKAFDSQKLIPINALLKLSLKTVKDGVTLTDEQYNQFNKYYSDFYQAFKEIEAEIPEFIRKNQISNDFNPEDTKLLHTAEQSYEKLNQLIAKYAYSNDKVWENEPWRSLENNNKIALQTPSFWMGGVSSDWRGSSSTLAYKKYIKDLPQATLMDSAIQASLSSINSGEGVGFDTYSPFVEPFAFAKDDFVQQINDYVKNFHDVQQDNYRENIDPNVNQSIARFTNSAFNAEYLDKWVNYLDDLKTYKKTFESTKSVYIQDLAKWGSLKQKPSATLAELIELKNTITKNISDKTPIMDDLNNGIDNDQTGLLKLTEDNNVSQYFKAYKDKFMNEFGAKLQSGLTKKDKLWNTINERVNQLEKDLKAKMADVHKLTNNELPKNQSQSNFVAIKPERADIIPQWNKILEELNNKINEKETEELQNSKNEAQKKLGQLEYLSPELINEYKQKINNSKTTSGDFVDRIVQEATIKNELAKDLSTEADLFLKSLKDKTVYLLADAPKPGEDASQTEKTYVKTAYDDLINKTLEYLGYDKSSNQFKNNDQHGKLQATASQNLKNISDLIQNTKKARLALNGADVVWKYGDQDTDKENVKASEVAKSEELMKKVTHTLQTTGGNNNANVMPQRDGENEQKVDFWQDWQVTDVQADTENSDDHNLVIKYKVLNPITNEKSEERTAKITGFYNTTKQNFKQKIQDAKKAINDKKYLSPEEKQEYLEQIDKLEQATDGVTKTYPQAGTELEEIVAKATTKDNNKKKLIDNLAKTYPNLNGPQLTQVKENIIASNIEPAADKTYTGSATEKVKTDAQNLNTAMGNLKELITDSAAIKKLPIYTELTNENVNKKHYEADIEAASSLVNDKSKNKENPTPDLANTNWDDQTIKPAVSKPTTANWNKEQVEHLISITKLDKLNTLKDGIDNLPNITENEKNKAKEKLGDSNNNLNDVINNIIAINKIKGDAIAKIEKLEFLTPEEKEKLKEKIQKVEFENNDKNDAEALKAINKILDSANHDNIDNALSQLSKEENKDKKAELIKKINNLINQNENGPIANQKDYSQQKDMFELLKEKDKVEDLLDKYKKANVLNDGFATLENQLKEAVKDLGQKLDKAKQSINIDTELADPKLKTLLTEVEPQVNKIQNQANAEVKIVDAIINATNTSQEEFDNKIAEAIGLLNAVNDHSYDQLKEALANSKYAELTNTSDANKGLSENEYAKLSPVTQADKSNIIASAIKKYGPYLKGNLTDEDKVKINDKIDQLSYLSDEEKTNYKNQIAQAKNQNQADEIFANASKNNEDKKVLVDQMLALEHLNQAQKDYFKSEIINHNLDEYRENTDSAADILDEAKKTDNAMAELEQAVNKALEVVNSNLYQEASDRAKAIYDKALSDAQKLLNNIAPSEYETPALKSEQVNKILKELVDAKMELYFDAIDRLPNLSDKEKEEAKQKIKNGNDDIAKQIIENAKLINKQKQDRIDQINQLSNLTDEEKNKFINDIKNVNFDNSNPSDAKKLEEIDKILANAKAADDLVSQILAKIHDLTRNYSEDKISDLENLINQLDNFSLPKDNYQNALNTIVNAHRLADALNNYKNADINDEESYNQAKNNLLSAIEKGKEAVKNPSLRSDILTDIARDTFSLKRNLVLADAELKLVDAILNNDQSIFEKTVKDLHKNDFTGYDLPTLELKVAKYFDIIAVSQKANNTAPKTVIDRLNDLNKNIKSFSNVIQSAIHKMQPTEAKDEILKWPWWLVLSLATVGMLTTLGIIVKVSKK
ncbi:GA module-containing protein [Mycoplasma buteonis]|uniref:GA module-containing protein n=1 Tax=Mycoplasma buteonis TaxID=171280 RepID=UPI0005611D2D|nr:GA module-containing protein [Mycoplasma buteonis]